MAKIVRKMLGFLMRKVNKRELRQTTLAVVDTMNQVKADGASMANTLDFFSISVCRRVHHRFAGERELQNKKDI